MKWLTNFDGPFPQRAFRKLLKPLIWEFFTTENRCSMTLFITQSTLLQSMPFQTLNLKCKDRPKLMRILEVFAIQLFQAIVSCQLS